MSTYFPMFMDISKVVTIVVGGRKIAERRIQTLRQFFAQIVVIAPKVTPIIQSLAEYGQLRWVDRSFQKEDFTDPNIAMAIIATDDRSVNYMAGELAKAEGIPVSVADCKEESTFYFPGIVKKDNVVIGVTSSGVNHKQAADITQRIRDLMEDI